MACSDTCCTCAQVTKASTVVLAVPSCPLVKLDDKHYKLVDKMEALVEDYPSMKDAKSLTVKGPVKFSKGVVIKGAVTVNNGECSAVVVLMTRHCKLHHAAWLQLRHPTGPKLLAGVLVSIVALGSVVEHQPDMQRTVFGVQDTAPLLRAEESKAGGNLLANHRGLVDWFIQGTKKAPVVCMSCYTLPWQFRQTFCNLAFIVVLLGSMSLCAASSNLAVIA